MLRTTDITRICSGSHGDPFSVLGPHVTPKDKLSIRAFLPGAAIVQLLDGGGNLIPGTMTQRDAAGFYEQTLTAAPKDGYCFQVRWEDGQESVVEDPYRFGQVLGDVDVWLLGEGTHLRPYEVLGANPREMDGIAGTSFAVWAPNASRVSVVGDFNFWDGRRHPMRLRRECGVWEIFLPRVAVGARYKFEIVDSKGHLLPARADPYARQGELRPATASVVAPMPAVIAPSGQRREANALDAPLSIYE
ncbi:MAG: 1,4-alpha-glucan branching enzyme, partial [Rhodoferax sp.]|nr:1,4-alpha-glucan branching enzyme [Rhodoferax sp.]